MTRPLKVFWLSLLGIFSLHGSSALASITQVLCIPGVVGESVVPGATGCIDVLAWSWGQNLPVTPGNGGGPGLPGKANLQDLSLTKYVDSSSDDLFKLIVTAKPVKGVIELRNYYSCGACDSPSPFLTIHLQSVFVASQSTGGSGGEDRLTENITLYFDEISYCYRPTVDGSLAAAQCFAYSKTTNGSITPF